MCYMTDESGEKCRDTWSSYRSPSCSPPLPLNKKDWEGIGEKKVRDFFFLSGIHFFNPCHNKTNPQPPWSTLGHPSLLITPSRHLLRRISSTPPPIGSWAQVKCGKELHSFNEFLDQYTCGSVIGIPPPDILCQRP